MSDTKWTKGEWEICCEGCDSIDVGIKSDDECFHHIATVENQDIDTPYNAHLITASPDGFEAASAAYMAILQSPMNEWRVEVGMDGTLAMLRDYIAKATDQDPQDVQADYERRARQ